MPELTHFQILIAVVSLSMAIQIAAAWMALRLIHVTDRHLAWILIALMSCLQAVRRGITLGELLSGSGLHSVVLADQILGLAISMCMFAGVSLIAPIFRALQRTGRELRATVAEKNLIIEDLRTAMDHVSVLSGLLPICSYCKRIRDDEGYWEQVDTYIREHSGVSFSHGICPECMAKIMSNMDAPPENGKASTPGT